jgi:hypothetical protein
MEEKMKTKRFKLYDIHSKNTCVDYIKQLSLEDEPYDIVIKPYSKKNQRSIDQNNRYWHIIREAANEIGYTTNELHGIMSVQVLGTNTISNLKGEPVEVAVQTSSLNITQFAEYMERVEAVLIEAGFYNPTTMSREVVIL